MANYIGNFEVLRMTAPDFAKRRVMSVSRAGIDGVALFDLGKKGQQFTLTTFAPQSHHVVAQQTSEAYTLVVGEDPIQLVFAGRPIPEYKFQVMDVRTILIKSILVGFHTSGTHYAVLRAEWDLLPIAV